MPKITKICHDLFLPNIYSIRLWFSAFDIIFAHLPPMFAKIAHSRLSLSSAKIARFVLSMFWIGKNLSPTLPRPGFSRALFRNRNRKLYVSEGCRWRGKVGGSYRKVINHFNVNWMRGKAKFERFEKWFRHFKVAFRFLKNRNLVIFDSFSWLCFFHFFHEPFYFLIVSHQSH